MMLISIGICMLGVVALIFDAPSWVLLLCMVPVFVCLVLTIAQIIIELFRS